MVIKIRIEHLKVAQSFQSDKNLKEGSPAKTLNRYICWVFCNKPTLENPARYMLGVLLQTSPLEALIRAGGYSWSMFPLMLQAYPCWYFRQSVVRSMPVASAIHRTDPKTCQRAG